MHIFNFINNLKSEQLFISINSNDIFREIKGITYNSKEVKDNYLFVCKGVTFKEEYLQGAIDSGAVCCIKEKSLNLKNKYDIPIIDVNDIRKAMPVIAKTYYGDISNNINLIGITGTKGKSTTTYYLKSILDEYTNKRTAFCSGINIYDGIIDEKSKLTTPENFEIYKHINNAIHSNIKFLTMEISSQALKYNRVDTLNYKVGCFLNIGEDHISEQEHPTYEDYLNSKLKLYKQCENFCYNLDCKEQKLLKENSKYCNNVITFSKENKNANIYAYKIETNKQNIIFYCKGQNLKNYKDFDDKFTLNSFAIINIENALAAISCAVLLNIPLEYIKNGLKKASIPGRMELFEHNGKIAVVDFAHNGLSFETFYKNAQIEFPNKQIISVFGSTGDKAINRRKDLATVSSKYCDYIILTEDDPGNEDPVEICKEMKNIIDKYKVKNEIVIDRPSAIKKAISLADKNTLIFIAGKGRDNTQKRHNKSIIIESDVDVVKKYL